MRYFKFDAEGDTVYVSGEDQVEAQAGFNEHIGEVPANMLTITEVKQSEIPEGEYVL